MSWCWASSRGPVGPVASIPTVSRLLNELDAPDVAAISLVRNRIREKVWEATAARHGGIPPAPTCYGDLGATIVIRIDASLVDSHSNKQHAAGNFKGGWGFHPLMAWCDNTGELLAIIARAGNAGSNTAADHIAIIDAAISAVPAKWRHNLLVTSDGPVEPASPHDTRRHRLDRGSEIKINDPYPLTCQEHSHPGEISRLATASTVAFDIRPPQPVRACCNGDRFFDALCIDPDFADLPSILRCTF
jgi:Transposase DDE domain group 1